MSKQIKIRKDTYTNLQTVIPAQAELGFDTTNKRLVAGDGTTYGGIQFPNYIDARNATYSYIALGGSANTYTATLAPAATSYTAGMSLLIKPNATNTGASTLNVNGLGAKNILKPSAGALVNLAANDLTNGAIHQVVYDGTQFILIGGSGGLVSVSQGNLNTSVGSVQTNYGATLYAILPGGEYGFYPQFKTASPSGLFFAAFACDNTGNTGVSLQTVAASILPTSYASILTMGSATSESVPTRYAQQRYVTSSPPFDLGDGDANGFMFLLVNKDGSVDASYFADVPPWAYNGKTNIRASAICSKTGKKFRQVMKRSLEDIMNGAEAVLQYEEITMSLKNRDMNDIPHPFMSKTEDQTVVLVDPMDDRIASLISHQNNGGIDEVSSALTKGLIYCDNEPMKRSGPAGIMVSGLRFKYSGGGKKGRK